MHLLLILLDSVNPFMLTLLNPYEDNRLHHFIIDEPEALRGYLNYQESPS